MCFLLCFFLLFSTTLAQLVQISWEATPGSDTNLLPYLINSSYLEQKRYLDAIFEALETTSTDDLISRKLNLPTVSIFSGFSAWNDKVGAGAQTLVDFQGGLNDTSIELLDQYAAILGYLLRQDAVLWYFREEKGGNDGFEGILKENVGLETFEDIYESIRKAFMSDKLAPGYTQTGFNLINYEESISPNIFFSGMKKVLNDLEEKKIGVSNVLEFKVKGNYLTNDWQKFKNGEEYLKIIGNLGDWAKEIWITRIDIINKEFEQKKFLSKFV